MRLNEFDNEKLAQYKTAAAADAAKADAEGDYKRGDKRFKGINSATKKQFANDAKKSQQKKFEMNEVAPPGDKAERMVRHIKAGYAQDGKLTPREKGIAFATAWKAHNAGQVEEATDPTRAKLERMIYKYYGQIYDYGDDDGLNYLDRNGELWNQLMDKYDGEIEDIVAREPTEVLMQAAQELKGIAGDMKYELDEAGVAEGSLNEFSTGGRDDDDGDDRGPGLTRQEFKNALKLALGYDMAGVDVSTFEGGMLRIEVNGERRIVPCNKLGVKDAAAFVKRIKNRGVAEESEKNPHTSALGKALWRALSKEKKASPAQVEKNKARWAQRQADKEQGVAEGSGQKPTITYKDLTLQYDYQTEDDDPEGYSTATTYYFDVFKDGKRVGEAEYFDYFGNLKIRINGKTKEFGFRHPLASQISQLVSSLPDEQKKDLSDPKFESQGVAEGFDKEAEAYKAHLLKTAPKVMDFLSKAVKGWRPSKEEMLGAIDTGYMVMKHTGDVKQAGKAMMDELNTLHRMSQGQQGVAEGFEPGHREIERWATQSEENQKIYNAYIKAGKMADEAYKQKDGAAYTGLQLRRKQIRDLIANKMSGQGVAEGSTSHAELAKMAHDAYVAASRKGNGPMAAHYLKQYQKHKADTAKVTKGVAKGSEAVCPRCHSSDIKTYSDGEKECNHCHRTWDVQGVTEGLIEMDKSQPSAGRDTGPRPGPDREAKPITAKKATKDAADMLNRAVKDSHKKKDVKEVQLDEFARGEGGYGPFKIYIGHHFTDRQFSTFGAAKEAVEILQNDDPALADGDWRIVNGTGKTVWEHVPAYDDMDESLAEDSLAAMRRLAGIVPQVPAVVPNGPRQYRHMPTAVQPL